MIDRYMIFQELLVKCVENVDIQVSHVTHGDARKRNGRRYNFYCDLENGKRCQQRENRPSHNLNWARPNKSQQKTKPIILNQKHIKNKNIMGRLFSLPPN